MLYKDWEMIIKLLVFTMIDNDLLKWLVFTTIYNDLLKWLVFTTIYNGFNKIEILTEAASSSLHPLPSKGVHLLLIVPNIISTIILNIILIIILINHDIDHTLDHQPLKVTGSHSYSWYHFAHELYVVDAVILKVY